MTLTAMAMKLEKPLKCNYMINKIPKMLQLLLFLLVDICYVSNGFSFI